MSVSSPDTEIFCDTSVLLNYVLDQGDDGAHNLLIESEELKVISNKVKEEFETVPQRRDEVYIDFIQIITSNEENLQELLPSDRDYLKSNDYGFFRELRSEIAEENTNREQLTKLREKQKIVDRRYGQTQEIIHRVCGQNDDLGLIFGLGKAVENDDDCQVLSDAVKWCRNGGSGRFATLDIGDLVSNSDEINKCIRNYHDKSLELEISRPGKFIK